MNECMTDLRLQEAVPDGDATCCSQAEIEAAKARLRHEARHLARALGVEIIALETERRGDRLFLRVTTDMFTDGGEPHTFDFDQAIRTIH